MWSHLLESFIQSNHFNVSCFYCQLSFCCSINANTNNDKSIQLMINWSFKLTFCPWPPFLVHIPRERVKGNVNISQYKRFMRDNILLSQLPNPFGLTLAPIWPAKKDYKPNPKKKVAQVKPLKVMFTIKWWQWKEVLLPHKLTWIVSLP